MTDNTIEYRVSFRTRNPRPAKADRVEHAGDGVAECPAAPSTPRKVHGRKDRRSSRDPSRGGTTQWLSPAKCARLAIQLALGHLVEQAIADGRLDDYADAADRFGVTRARISQVVALTLLAPEIQEDIVEGRIPIGVRGVRRIVGHANWAVQAKHWRKAR